MNMNEGQPISRREALKRGGKIVAPFLVPGFLNLLAAACAPRPTQPPPAATAEMSSPTAIPTEAKPTVAPTEAPRATATEAPKLSNDQIIDQIQSLGASIHSLPKIAPRITDQQHEQNKNTMDSLFLNPAMEALKNNDLGTARNKLLGAKNQITTYGDPLKSVSVPKDIQQKHDPKGKYITKNDSVDPRILEHYLALVDLLVATDSSYSETSK